MTFTSRPMPEDFATLAATMSGNALAKHYTAKKAVIRRWYEEAGIPRRAPCGTLPVPDGYADYRPGVIQKVAAAHYGAHLETIRRWDRVCGIVARPAAKPKPVKAAARTVKPQAYMTAPVDRGYRDPSLAGRAADHLRRLGAVYRCAPTGRADPKGTHWRRGNAVLTDAELIERAIRLGFVADRWAEAA